MAYSVYRIPGLNYGQHPRDVVFLESAEDTRINAKGVFEGLIPKHRQEMLGKFELWQRGEQHVNRYFHGFDGDDFRECFVFKRKQAGTYHRFYGFLIHPHPLTQPGYRVCVLVSHAIKSQEGTDPSELSFANSLRTDSRVIAAVKREFPERRGGSHAPLDIHRR